MFGIARIIGFIVMYYCYYYSNIYFRLLVISWRSSGKSSDQSDLLLHFTNAVCIVH